MTDKPHPIEVKNGKTMPVHSSFPFFSLRNQIDRLIDDFSTMFDRDLLGHHVFDMPRLPSLASEVGAIVPAIDMVEEEKSYRIMVELPGITEKDIEVMKDGDLLTIKGEKKEMHEEKERGFYVSERRYGSFQRSLRLPDGIDENKIDAKFDNGVLTITLPKSPETITKPKKIEVKAK